MVIVVFGFKFFSNVIGIVIAVVIDGFVGIELFGEKIFM